MYSSDICILCKWVEGTSCSFSGLNNGCNDCVLTLALDLKVSFTWSTCLLEILVFTLVIWIGLLKYKHSPWLVFFVLKYFSELENIVYLTLWYQSYSVSLEWKEGGDMSHLLVLPVIKEKQNGACSIQGGHYCQAASLKIFL